MTASASRRAAMALLLLLTVLTTACAKGEDPAETGRYELPDGEVAQYDTAYIAAVQVPMDGEDGFILLRNNWDGPADLGGWAIRGRNNRTIRIPPSTIMEPEGELKILLGKGQSDATTLYVDTDERILEWDRLRLVDAADETVARFQYGR